MFPAMLLREWDSLSSGCMKHSGFSSDAIQESRMRSYSPVSPSTALVSYCVKRKRILAAMVWKAVVTSAVQVADGQLDM